MALDNYKNLEPFRFWCQTVLPSVYDDSLSYYELLCKVVKYLNEMNDNIDTLHGVVEDYTQRFEELKSYVDNYFENLNVQEEINTKLDEMAESGALTTLLEPFIPALVTNWLEENIEPTTPPVDSTLSVSGAAADSKTVGDKLLNGRAISEIELMPDARYTGTLPTDATPLSLPNNTWIRVSGAVLKAMLSGSTTFTWLDELSDAVTYILERHFSAVNGVSAWAIRNLGGHALFTGYNLGSSLNTINWFNRKTDTTLSVASRPADAKTVGDMLLNGRAISEIELMPDARYTGTLPTDATPLSLPNNTWIRVSGAVLKAMLSGNTTFTWLDELNDAVTYILERHFSVVSGVSAWTIRNLGGHVLFTGYNLSSSLNTINWFNRKTDTTLSVASRPADAKTVGEKFDTVNNLIYANRNSDENTPLPVTIYSPPVVPDNWESNPEWNTTPEQCVISQMPANSRFQVLGSILLAYLPNDFPWRDEIKLLTSYNIECRAYTTSAASKEFHIHAINSGTEYYGWNRSINPAPYWQKLQPEKIVKILFIGNSYTEDSVVYSPFLVRSLAPDVLFTIGISYISGGNTVDYADSFDNDTDTPTYFKIKGTQTAWTNLGRKTIKQILADEQWDMIFFNTVSIDEGSNPPTFVNFNGFLDKIVKYKMQSQSTPIRYGYLNTQVRVGGTISFEEAKVRANIILNTTPLNCLIPCGTAVEIARTTSLDSLGDYGHLAEDSNGHMQEGLPRLLTAYVTTLSLLSFVGVDWHGILGETTRPDSDFPTTINVPGRQGNVTGVNDDNCILAQKCAIAAVKKPFEISDII